MQQEFKTQRNPGKGKVIKSREELRSYLDVIKTRSEYFNIIAGMQIADSGKDACFKGSKGSLMPLHSLVCVSAVGSDGRLEKGHVIDENSISNVALSKIEVRVYVVPLDSMHLNEIKEGIRSLLSECSFIGAFGDREYIRVHLTSSDSSLPCDPVILYNPLGKDMDKYSNRVYPSRVFDSFFVYGDREILECARLSLLEDLKMPRANRMVDKINDRRRRYAGIMRTGKQTWKGHTAIHYSLDDGLAYYNTFVSPGGVKFEIKSFKYGPLRFVQTVLEHQISKLLLHLVTSGRVLEAQDIILGLPTPTAEKFMFMKDTLDNIFRLSRNEVDDVIDSYAYFLYLYHVSEYSAKNGIPILEFDRKEVNERISSLYTILNPGIFNWNNV